MKSKPPSHRPDRVVTAAVRRALRRTGFTFIELIGVLGIVTVLVAVVTLNVINQMKRAAREAEAKSMETMRDALRAHILRTKTIPAPSAWPQAIAAELGVPVSRVLNTRVGFARYFQDDPNLAIGSPTNATRSLPFSQGVTGSVEPLNPRLLLVSSLATNLPFIPNQTTAFNEVWDTPENTIPASWTAWRVPPEDLRIVRLDLRGLFRRIVFNNLDPNNDAPYAIESGFSATPLASTSGRRPHRPGFDEDELPVGAAMLFDPSALLAFAPPPPRPPPPPPPPPAPTGPVLEIRKLAPGQRFEAWYLETTPVQLRFADESLQAREFVRDDVSYVFENGRWSRYLNYGPRPPLSGFGLLAEEFRESSPPAGADFGATPQAVMEEMFTYLYTYGIWATGNPPAVQPFDPGGGAPTSLVPSHQVLLDAKDRLGAISGNLIR